MAENLVRPSTASLAAAALLAMAALGGCGGGGGSAGTGTGSLPSGATAPTANFAFSCTDLSCTFTSTSTNQVVNDAIASYSWNFGDASSAATTASPTHAFTAAGSYTVTLTVADVLGATSSAVKQVTVTAPPVPAAPHANFTVSCVSLDCTFTDTSTFDAGSTLQFRTWDFGDSTPTASTSPVTHSYAAGTLASYTASLTVVDAAGKTSKSTQTVRVAPPASTLNCGSGSSCVLTLTQAARVTATLVSRSCSAQGNRVVITSPINETVFADGCTTAPGTAVTINGGAAFTANTTLEVAVLSGILPTASIVFPPTIRVSGDFTNGWTLTFDDGYGGPGEPDFNDLVILVKAAP